MGKLALIGALIAGAHGLSGVTPHQAIQALRDNVWVAQRTQVACKPSGQAELCQTVDQTQYTDQVFGPSTVVGTTTFRVSRGPHGYRVQVVVPDHFDIYAG